MAAEDRLPGGFGYSRTRERTDWRGIMADQTVRVESLPTDGRERVAYDLMLLVAGHTKWEGLKSRDDFLTLYGQCRAAVNGVTHRPK